MQQHQSNQLVITPEWIRNSCIRNLQQYFIVNEGQSILLCSFEYRLQVRLLRRVLPSNNPDIRQAQLSPHRYLQKLYQGFNIAKGRGFTTRVIRPFSMFLVSSNRADRNPLIKDAHPDVVNAPVYPLLLAPVGKLTPAQAMYHFLSGYTAKVAGTEKGLVGVEPEFSTCFAAPFLPRPPAEYGNLLRNLIAKHKVDCWLVNSGWTGGIYGVGRRMPIKATRALVTGALDGSLRNASYRTDPYFGFSVPTSVPGVEPHLLYPMKTWKDKAAFDDTARKLVRMFQENFVKYEKHVDADVRAAAPEVRIAAE